MIRLIYLAAIIVASVTLAAAQESGSLCPTIEVIGPAGITQPRDEMTFVAKTGGTGLDIRFEWTAELGRIVKGQGTAAVTVIGDEPNTNVRATVKIFGFPNACENTASESAGIAPVPSFCSLDEWGDLKPNDVRGRLDSFFTELRNNPDNKGVFLFVGVPAEKRTIDHPKIKFVLAHTKFRDFDSDRFIFAFDTGDPIQANVQMPIRTMLYRIPSGMKLPLSDVLIIEASVRKQKELK